MNKNTFVLIRQRYRARDIFVFMMSYYMYMRQHEQQQHEAKAATEITAISVRKSICDTLYILFVAALARTTYT